MWGGNSFTKFMIIDTLMIEICIEQFPNAMLNESIQHEAGSNIPQQYRLQIFLGDVRKLAH